jgi:hypothetical protein
MESLMKMKLAFGLVTHLRQKTKTKKSAFTALTVFFMLVEINAKSFPYL